MEALHPLDATFVDMLHTVRTEVDARLGAFWRAKVEEVGRHGPDVRALAQAAMDLTMRGGKRFRAALVAIAYDGVRESTTGLEPAYVGGVAMELLHTYLLIQDDWMDDDATRRGGPSVHAALAAHHGDRARGASSAILASDLAWGGAVATLASAPVDPEHLLAALRLFCRIHDDVISGQELDIAGRAEDTEAMHALKTGSYTVRGPLALGATLAGAPASVIAELDRYAIPLGVAFQLRDDLLGAFAGTADTGKAIGGDLRAGKRTSLVANALELLDEPGRAALAATLGNPKAPMEDILRVSMLLDTCGARAAVEERLADLVAHARQRAGALPLSARARRMLEEAARSIGSTGSSSLSTGGL